MWDLVGLYVSVISFAELRFPAWMGSIQYVGGGIEVSQSVCPDQCFLSMEMEMPVQAEVEAFHWMGGRDRRIHF